MVIPPLTDNVKKRGFLPFLLGVLLGMALVCAAVYVYFASGCAPVATADPELPFESLLAGKALHARMLREVPRSASPVGTPDDLLAGARRPEVVSPAGDPIESDEVLDVHLALRDFQGPLTDLFKQPSRDRS